MKQKVAVYGTLKEGFGNHRLLTGIPHVKAISSPLYSMISLGGFPALVPGVNRVDVEIYEVTPEVMARLDRLEGYPHMYTREIRSFTDHSGVNHQAWVYLWAEDVQPRQYSYVQNFIGGQVPRLTWVRDSRKVYSDTPEALEVTTTVSLPPPPAKENLCDIKEKSIDILDPKSYVGGEKAILSYL
jgi:gamma-glutamylcyclotransferase (GGCT)/AIG2-like uncharacterized protein YtfP